MLAELIIPIAMAIAASKVALATLPSCTLEANVGKSLMKIKKAIICTVKAIVAQINKSSAAILCAIDLCNGMQNPIMAPPNEIAAAVFPSRINLISAYGVIRI